MNIDFGTAFHKPNGNAVKVTINEFRDKLYLHIRDYTMDTNGDCIYECLVNATTNAENTGCDCKDGYIKDRKWHQI